jgi:non-specific protein-tyrosine kinase
MELRQYWHLLRKWIWLIVLGALLAGGAAFVINRNTTPVYQADTSLLVTPGSTQALDNYSSLIASERLAQTYAQLLQSGPVLEETQWRLEAMAADGVPVGDPSSGFSVASQAVRDTQLLGLSVTGTDPDLITAAANTLVEVFIEWQAEIQRSRYAESKANLNSEMEQLQQSIQETEDAIRALQAQGDEADPNELSRLQDQLAQDRQSYSALLSSYSSINLAEANSGATVTVVTPATRPMAPIRPQVMRNTLLVAVVGAIAAAGVAFLIEYVDDTVKSPEDLEGSGMGVIGVVHRINHSARGERLPVFTITQSKSLVAEAYRTLRTNLQFSSLDNPLRSLVVTSAVATEGKTTTAANLAVVLAQSGKRVVLVDADLRRPSAHKLFGLSNGAGLTTALVEEPKALNGFLRDTEVANLRLLTAGPVPPNPQELLGSQRMEEMLHKLEGDVDIVVIDTPPTLVVADANILAARADGVLMVVNTGSTRRAAVRQAVEGIQQVGANLIGVVLNMVDTRGVRGSYYYYPSYYYYSHYYGREQTPQPTGWLQRLRRQERRPVPEQDQASEGLPPVSDLPSARPSEEMPSPLEEDASGRDNERASDDGASGSDDLGLAHQPSDELWQQIEPLLPTPKPKKRRGRPRIDDRQVMTAILYVLRTGCQWKALPRELGAASTVHDRYTEWRKAGVFERMRQAGLPEHPELEGLVWD